MRTVVGQQALNPLSLVVALGILVLALSAPAVHAQGVAGYASSTQWTTVIEYQTLSGYNFDNVNVTWTNSNDCGSFTSQRAGATWDWGTGVGAIPCTSSLPTGTITQTVSSGGVVLASCTDTQGAATYGSEILTSGVIPSECTNTGAGVSINSFFAQAYDASGNPISAGSGGNDDWIIALVVIIILVLLLLFFYMRRKRKTSPAAATAQKLAGEAEMEAKKIAAETEKEAKVAVDKVKAALNRRTTPAAARGQGPTVSPASVAQEPGKSYCANCGSVLDPGASFCRSCGTKVS